MHDEEESQDIQGVYVDFTKLGFLSYDSSFPENREKKYLVISKTALLKVKKMCKIQKTKKFSGRETFLFLNVTDGLELGQTVDHIKIGAYDDEGYVDYVDLSKAI
jgi:hypothetical protein